MCGERESGEGGIPESVSSALHTGWGPSQRGEGRSLNRKVWIREINQEDKEEASCIGRARQTDGGGFWKLGQTYEEAFSRLKVSSLTNYTTSV